MLETDSHGGSIECTVLVYGIKASLVCMESACSYDNDPFVLEPGQNKMVANVVFVFFDGHLMSIKRFRNYAKDLGRHRGFDPGVDVGDSLDETC